MTSLLLAVGWILFATPVTPAPFEPDGYLAKLAGTWKVTGKAEGDPVDQRLDATWVLEQRFLELRFTATASPAPGLPAYDARVFIGSDDGGKSYVAYWLDVFGAKASTHGKGQRNGDALSLIYEYPNQQFRNTFTPSAARTWRLLIESKGKSGKWETFADETLTRIDSK